MKKKQSKPDFIRLDESYDLFARSLANTTRKHHHTKNKTDELEKSYEIMQHRFNLYFQNVIWNEYSSKKHLYIHDSDNTIYVYDKEKFSQARNKYEYAMENDEKKLDEEFDNMFRGNFMYEDDYIELEFENNEKDLKQMIEFMKKELVEPLFQKKLSKNQEKDFIKYANELDYIRQKHSFAVDSLQELSEEYQSYFEELIEHLKKDKNYKFNENTCEIFTVQDEETLKWSIIYSEN